MHELSLTRDILDAVVRYANDAGAHRVTRIVLRVGVVNGFEREWVQSYLDHLSAGTVAQGAQVELRVIPIVVECTECGNEFRIDVDQMASFACPECGCGEGDMVAGNEMAIDRIEIEQ